MSALLKAEKIHFNVKNREKPILSEISLEIYPQDFIVILGHNGSGKTSLLKILSGDKTPTAGKIFADDLNFSQIPDGVKAQHFLTLTQRPEERLFFELTVEENIILWESRFAAGERLNIEQIIQETNLDGRFLNILNQPVYTLSGGEKQALLIALALAHPPKILYLDEHTSALDPKASEKIMAETARIILNKKITTIMITHSLEDALLYGDRLIILNEGTIIVDQKKSSNLTSNDLKALMN